jgi:GT2 family glycosyltransferase
VTSPQVTPIATVVIVNWNGAHLLPDCLDGLRRQSDEIAFETWVVDNASHDDSEKLLAEQYPEVRVLQSGSNRGFAGGNNVALREVTTPFAVLLNNDAVPEPDWLAKLLAPMLADGTQDTAQIGATTGRVLFTPRFVRLSLACEGFVPGPHDTRELGVRIYSVQAGPAGEEPATVTPQVLWEQLTYGAEGPSDGRYFWTRPAGTLLVPVPASGPVEITVGWAAEAAKPVELSWTDPDGSTDVVELSAGVEPGFVTFRLPAGVPRVDVINNVGGIVVGEGYGADRGYQQVDEGQFDSPEEVFTACGNGLAMRTELGRELGWFDDDFFLYYEDTDLSWRLRSLGYAIWYEPKAVLRHLHSATSQEWSPLFVFHVDRNRLLMLTKNATPELAARAVGRYPLTTASMFVRTVRQGIKARQRPALRPTLLRLRVIISFLRLVPKMLARRRHIARDSVVARRTLQRRWVSAVPLASASGAAGNEPIPAEEPAA